jgi:hypothetical protein
MAVSFSGELAYEIHVPNSALYAAYLALTDAGVEHELGLFGARAVESMRMEKGFLHWKSDLITELDPFETGLDRFVKMDKPDFIGKPRWKTAFARAFRNAWCLWKSIAIMRLPMAVHRLCKGAMSLAPSPLGHGGIALAKTWPTLLLTPNFPKLVHV